MQPRRSFLASGAVGAIAATAGCLDFLLGDDLSFSATAASVSDSALTETGYQENQTRSQTFERTFEVGGESRTVSITNQYAEYDRTVDLAVLGIGEQRAATFTAATTPKAEVLGQTSNPIADMDAEEIVRRSQGRYGTFEDLEVVNTFDVTLLGKQTTVTRFHGSAQLAGAGQDVEAEIQVSEAVGSGDDFALAVGGYPQQLADTEREHYRTLVDGVQHDG